MRRISAMCYVAEKRGAAVQWNGLWTFSAGIRAVTRVEGVPQGLAQGATVRRTQRAAVSRVAAGAALRDAGGVAVARLEPHARGVATRAAHARVERQVRDGDQGPAGGVRAVQHHEGACACRVCV